MRTYFLRSVACKLHIKLMRKCEDMKKHLKFFFVIAILVLTLTACTDKSKQDADKLTADIVDYAQKQVDNTVDYFKENGGDISEKIIEGLDDVAHAIKDEAEDLVGAVKDDFEGNVKDVIDETKESLENAKDEVKEDIEEVKDNIKEGVDDAKDDVKDAVEGAKDDIKDAVEDVKEGAGEIKDEVVEYVKYRFRNYKLLDQHYEKHGIEMGFASREDYEKAASDVINNPNALHKIEKEDGDYVYYVEETNEFVILSTDGYIRTYFLPSGGKKYYDKQ